MNSHNCDKEVVIEIIREDLAEIKKDVKDLLAFKWQLIGITISVSAIIGLGFKIFEAIAN